MTLKQYKITQLAVTLVLAIVSIAAVTLDNLALVIITAGFSLLTLQILRSKVTEITTDERDIEASDHAAKLAIRVFNWLALAAALLFWANSSLNPSYEPIAVTLVYLVCFLAILHSLTFLYRIKLSFLSKKNVYLGLGIILLLILVLAGVRLLSGEDDWVCDHGQWVAHGHPDFHAPTSKCTR